MQVYKMRIKTHFFIIFHIWMLRIKLTPPVTVLPAPVSVLHSSEILLLLPAMMGPDLFCALFFLGSARCPKDGNHDLFIS